MFNSLKFRLISGFFALILPSITWAQCSMCKAVAESSREGGSPIAEGLNDGILYLMAFPYLLMLVVGIAWYRHSKKAEAEPIHP